MKYKIRLEKPNSTDPTFLLMDCECPDGRLRLFLKDKVLPTDWNKKLQMVTSQSPINTKLSKISMKMNSLAFAGEVLTKQHLKLALQQTLGMTKFVKERSASFLDMWDKITEERRNGKELNNGKRFEENTLKTYINVRGWVETYCKHIYPSLITMQAFTIEDYKKFLEFLTKQESLSLNSIGLILDKLKAFLSAAYSRNWHTNLVFRDPNFKSYSEKTTKISVPLDVLEKINAMELSGQMARARDWFLIESFTALRVGDCMSLTKENIINGTITKISTKTNTKTVVPVHRIIKNVMERNSGGFPKEMEIRDLNLNIRMVCKQTGMMDDKVLIVHTRQGKLIQEYKNKYDLVTSHSGRRSFITNSRNFMSRENRKKIAGIIMEKTMDTYDKTSAEDVAETVKDNEFWK